MKVPTPETYAKRQAKAEERQARIAARKATAARIANLRKGAR